LPVFKIHPPIENSVDRGIIGTTRFLRAEGVKAADIRDARVNCAKEKNVETF
jgi:hypothetical protein